MRLLLDAHLSSRRIGAPLARKGHDVIGLDRDRDLSALTDEQVLELAASKGRVVVTHNLRHFVPILRRWAEAGHTHAGCILVALAPNAYGPVLRGLAALFAAHPEQADWIDRAEFLA